mgnify:CR=1 FL=1
MSEKETIEKKACPLLSIGAGGEALIECVEEDCMFWISEKEDCAIAMIARALAGLKPRTKKEMG